MKTLVPFEFTCWNCTKARLMAKATKSRFCSTRKIAVVGFIFLVFCCSVSAKAQTNSKIDQIFTQDNIGAQIAYLETITGPAWRIAAANAGAPEERQYKVDQCVVDVGVTNNVIIYLGINVSAACSVNLNSFLDRTPEIPPTNELTFGSFEQAIGQGGFYADCLGMSCGNAADPTVYYEYEGPHSDNFLQIAIGVDVTDDKSIDAANKWWILMEKTAGEGYVDNERFNCDGTFDLDAQTLFENIKITSILIGSKVFGPWSSCNGSSSSSTPTSPPETATASPLKNYGYLGVESQVISAKMATALGLSGANPADDGASVIAVAAESPAFRSGLKAGDVITEVNGFAVTNPTDLAFDIMSIDPGQSAAITYLRNRQSHIVTVGITGRPLNLGQALSPLSNQQPTSQPSNLVLGVGLTPLTPQIDGQFGFPISARGAFVAQVAKNSAADKAGVQVGDLIVGLGPTPITDPSGVVAGMDGVRKTGSSAVVLRVIRHGKAIFVEVYFDK